MMNSGGMSDMIRQMMEKKQGGDGGGEAFSFAGQYASTVRREQAPDGSMREFVWITQEAEPDVSAPDEEWSNAPGVKKVYGSWNEYAVSQDDEGNMMIADDDFVAKQDDSGNYTLDEGTMDGQDRGREAAGKAQGGPGASKMEDLMEMLGGMRGQGGQPAPGRQMGMGGKIYKRGGRFPDLNKDGKITMADILRGRGVRR
jgi:hypothetical protein